MSTTSELQNLRPAADQEAAGDRRTTPTWDDEIDLADLIVPLIRGWRTIAGLTLVSMLIAAALSLWVIPPAYEADALLTARTEVTLGGQALPFTLTLPSPGLDALAEVATRTEILGPVAERHAVAGGVETLREMIEARADSRTGLLRITVEAGTAEQAQELANHVAAALSAWTVEVNRREAVRRLAAMEAQLARDVEALEAERNRTPMKLEGVLVAGSPNEPLSQLNPTWRDLSDRLALARAQLQAARGLRHELESGSNLSEDVADQLAGAITTAPADLPEDPTWPRTALNAAVSGMLGFMFSIFGVLGGKVWREQVVPVLRGKGVVGA